MQRKKYSAAFKAKVALELVKEHKTLNEVATKYGVHPNMITKWKKQLLDHLPELFSKNGQKGEQDTEKLIESLYQKIGQLEVEVDWLKKKSEQLR
jgi:transposase-like protein